MTHDNNALPSLPEPGHWYFDGGECVPTDGYTADQMRAYAQANVQALVAMEKDAARYLKLLSKAKQLLEFEQADIHWHDNGSRVSLLDEIDAALLESKT
jgi:hypothetical protein